MEDVVTISNGLKIGNNKIGIVISHDEEQFHCGISYELDKGFKVLHLAWHHHLEFTEDSNEFTHWIKPNIHEIRQKMISTKCRRIKNNLHKMPVPYALLYDQTTFNQEGILMLGENEHGLTCATFVLAVFNSCGIKLIDTEHWPIREEDKVWHEQIIRILNSSRSVSMEHKRNVANEKGCARFRPEEVGMSSTFLPQPGPIEEIIQKGKLLRDYIMQLN